jgi:photosystem II stability/assembly factor-like uncharacterized protein
MSLPVRRPTNGGGSTSGARPQRRAVALVLGATVLLLSACTYRYTWDSRGPFETSGAIREVIVDPANPNRLYAAAENGGVWVLDDVRTAGNGWRPLSDDLENMQMRGIAKSAVDSNYIVAGNALGFVYHTKNHGQTWTRVTDQNFQYIRRLFVSEGLTRIPAGNYTRLAKETRIYIASRNGLFRIHLANNDFVRTDTLFPHDTGQGTDVLDVVRHPTNQQLLYVGVRGTGVFRNDQDGAGSWTLSASWAAFADPQVPMIKLGINGSRVVAKMGRNVIVNDNNGNAGSWTQTAAAVPWAATDVGGSDIGYRGNYSGLAGEWDHAIAVHPTDASTIVVGQNALFVTTDGGATWQPVNSGHEDIQSLAFPPAGDRVFICNDGGVFSSALDGSNATDLNTRLTTMQFYRVGLNGTVAVGNADHQGIRGTTDVGASSVQWVRATPSSNGFGNNGLENDFVFADAANAGRFFIAFQSQFLLRLRFPAVNATQDLLPMDPPATPLQPFTTRGGNNPVLNQLNYAVGTLAIDPRPGANIILTAAHQVINNTFTIQITSNGNANPTGAPPNGCGDNNNRTFCFPTPVGNTAVWTTSFGPPIATPIVSIAFSRTEARKVYALDEAGTVRVKDDIDDAANWRQVGAFAVGANDFARQILPSVTTAGTIYAMSHRSFMVSTDSGATWTPRGQATLPVSKFNAIASHPTRGRLLYLATDSDVLVSGNGGTTWESIGASLPNAPVMQLFTDTSFLYAVTFGRGLWRARLPS